MRPALPLSAAGVAAALLLLLLFFVSNTSTASARAMRGLQEEEDEEAATATLAPTTDQTSDPPTRSSPTSPDEAWSCVTSDNPSEEERKVALDTERGGSPEVPFPPAPILVRHGIFFHIVHRKDGVGMITQNQIQAQITQLNRAFSGQEDSRNMPDTRIRFFIEGVEYYEDDDLFYQCGPEEVLKQPRAVNTDTVLNVYTCTISMIVGDATMPGALEPRTYRVLPNNHWRYGIRLHYAAFYGGGLNNLDKGNILVHEIGHFYGLFHPYLDSCAPGAWSDRIDDTPRMRDNVKGSCSKNKGLRSCSKFIADNPPDDISNYMVSTDDSCRNHFTRGQVAWMQNSLALNKPQLIAKFAGGKGDVDTTTSPPTPSTTSSTACTWRIKAGVRGSPIQMDMDCQLPLRVGKKTFGSTPPMVKQSRPFQYASVSGLEMMDYWCTPVGTTKYAPKGATKYLWGPAECV